MAAFDISAVDPKSHLYYPADRSNAALDIIDTRSNVGDDPNSGAVSVVDPRRMVEVARFPVTGCNGAGLALAPGQKLLVGCSLTNNSQIISARDGSLLAEIPQISGADEVWYNAGDSRFYLAGRSNPATAGGRRSVSSTRSPTSS